MNVSRWLAPFVCTVFGLYGLIWSLIPSPNMGHLRMGGAFAGVFFLLLALRYISASRAESSQPQGGALVEHK
jgi:hypothetical protein